MKKAMKIFKIPDDDGNITYRVQTPDGVWHDTDELGNFLPEGSEAPRKEPGETEVIPVNTEEYGLNRAARPRNSRLDRSKLIEAGFEPLPDWRDALRRYLKEMPED